MKSVKWTIHKIAGSDARGEKAMFAIVPDDGTEGIILGECSEVARVSERLTAFLETGEHDGAMPDIDPRLGALWLTAAEASQKFDVPHSSVTWACREGKIRHAEKDRGQWNFPQRTFMAWKRNRPGRGRSNPSDDIQREMAKQYREHTGDIPRGQLWQPCEVPGCDREPVCMNCLRCQDVHCHCFDDET
jgi:hypothetical protein